MTLRDSLVTLADGVRALLLPSRMDQAPHLLTIRTRAWSGGVRGLGTPTDTDLVMPQKLPIRLVSVHEVSDSGGMLEMGDISVRHITPSNGAVGFTPDQLKPPITTDGTERIYVITGPHAGEYEIVELQTWRNYSYGLILRRRITDPG